MATQLTDLYQFNTVSGTVMPDTSAIKAAIVSDFQDNVFKATIDQSQETPMGRLIDWLSVAFASIVRLNAANASQMNLNYATGQYLDAIGALFGLTRKTASYTTVPVTLYGTAGATIPAGVTARTQDGDVFALMESTVIGQNGQTDPALSQPYFHAVESGAVPCPYGELNIINSAVVGWTGISNSSGTLGAPAESDDDFRARIMASRYAGTGSLGDIYRNIAALGPGISCLVYENNDLPDHVYNGVVVKGHSIYVCVYGMGENTATRADVAQAIFKSKPVGCGYTTTINGSSAPIVEYVVDEQSGISYPVYFYEPATVTPQVNITFSRGNYTGASIGSDIASAVSSFINALKIGESISAFDLAIAITKAIPEIMLRTVSFGTSNDSTFQVYSYQKAVMNSSDIGQIVLAEVDQNIF